MPYAFKADGLDEIADMLGKVNEDSQSIAALALYKGAGVIADSVSKGARGLRTAPFKYAKGGEQRELSPEEKQVLVENGSIGIAKFGKNGLTVETSVGYNQSGYADVNFTHMRSKSRTNYKKGTQNQKPIGVIANSVNSGTSFMKKQPFIRKAVSQSKGTATEVITGEVERLVGEIMK